MLLKTTGRKSLFCLEMKDGPLTGVDFVNPLVLWMATVSSITVAVRTDRSLLDAFVNTEPFSEALEQKSAKRPFDHCLAVDVFVPALSNGMDNL